MPDGEFEELLSNIWTPVAIDIQHFLTSFNMNVILAIDPPDPDLHNNKTDKGSRTGELSNASEVSWRGRDASVSPLGS